jgi:RNA recognition motif-containing protein
MKVFFGKFHCKVTVEEIEDVFGAFGEVRYVQLLRFPDGESRGCGFVQMVEDNDAERAIQLLNGAVHVGRRLHVTRAKPHDVYEAEKSKMEEKR